MSKASPVVRCLFEIAVPRPNFTLTTPFPNWRHAISRVHSSTHPPTPTPFAYAYAYPYLFQTNPNHAARALPSQQRTRLHNRDPLAYKVLSQRVSAVNPFSALVMFGIAVPTFQSQKPILDRTVSRSLRLSLFLCLSLSMSQFEPRSDREMSFAQINMVPNRNPNPKVGGGLRLMRRRRSPNLVCNPNPNPTSQEPGGKSTFYTTEAHSHG